jgi:ImpA, N-terminal, type VI secretion system
MDKVELLFENLLKPITEENPCGYDISYDPEFLEIKGQLKEVENFDKGIWKEKKVKDKNLEEIQNICFKLFSEKSKNLFILSIIIDLRANLYGIYGVSDSLELLKLSIKNYWNNIYPIDEENIGTLKKELLIFTDKKLNQSITKNLLFKVDNKLGKINYDMYIDFIKNKKKDNNKNILDIHEEINKCLANIEEINSIINTSDNNENNYFNKSSQSLNNIISIYDSAKTHETEDIDKTEIEDSITPEYPIHTRQDLYNQIYTLSKKLLEIEPHSPVPLMIIRALHWKDKNFVEILSTFVPQGDESHNLINAVFGMKVINDED